MLLEGHLFLMKFAVLIVSPRMRKSRLQKQTSRYLDQRAVLSLRHAVLLWGMRNCESSSDPVLTQKFVEGMVHELLPVCKNFILLIFQKGFEILERIEHLVLPFYQVDLALTRTVVYKGYKISCLIFALLDSILIGPHIRVNDFE